MKTLRLLWHNLILNSRKTNQVPEIHENKEISINYVMNKMWWIQNKINVDNVFVYKITLKVINDNVDQESKFIKVCKQNEWEMTKMNRFNWRRIKVTL